MIKNLYILCGVPGSGKSTYARLNANAPDTIIISRDAIRFSLLSEKDDYFAKEKEVKNLYFDKINESLKSPEIVNVYADATHLTEKARNELISNVFPFGVPSHIRITTIYVNTNLETCIARNLQRSGRECVPDTVIYNMYNSMKDPKEDKIKYYETIEVNFNE